MGTRTLDELLGEQGRSTKRSAPTGRQAGRQRPEVSGLGVRDIILPGRSPAGAGGGGEKAAQANVIRRREETSATRSLLNTAKVMEENPTALRLKELGNPGAGGRAHRPDFGIRWPDQVLNGLVPLKQA